MASKAKDINFPSSVEGNIRTTGGSLTLGNGELAIVNVKETVSGKGAKVLGDFSNLKRDHKLAIRMGKPYVGVSRSEDNKPLSSIPFQISDVKDIRVSTPERLGVKTDDMVIGFNGKAGTGIDLEIEDVESIDLTIKGDLLRMIGITAGEYTIHYQILAPVNVTKNTTDAVALASEWTMQELITEAFEYFKEYELPTGKKLVDYLDVILTDSTNGVAVGVVQNFYELVLEDSGFKSALGNVQSQYPDLEVVQDTSDAGVSTYVVKAGSLPADYQEKAGAILKGCATCPDNYTLLSDGIVYEVEITNPEDETATVQALPGAEATSAQRNNVTGDTSTYSVVTDDALTAGEISTFESANPGSTIYLISEDVVSLCKEALKPAVSWVLQGTDCRYSTEDYTITVADTECGQDRLAELQEQYPSLTVAIADSDSTNSDVTLTGASGTANITIDATDYLATFDTDLATTVSNFVTAHASAILAASGLTVTGSGDVISFKGLTVGFSTPTIANATTDLAGTVATAALPAKAACQTTYTTTVNTSLVCEECDEIFRNVFESESPKMFLGVDWEKEDRSWNGTAEMGLRFRAKRSSLSGDEFLRHEIPFIDDSVEISLAGGYPTHTNLNYGSGGQSGRFVVKVLQRKAKGQNLGGNLWKFENEAAWHFYGRGMEDRGNYAKIRLGLESRLRGLENYLVYSINVAPLSYNTDFQQPQNGAMTYHIVCPLGKQEALELVLNKMAAAAGLPQIKSVAV
jgi:hypothetical protein|tara:strand:- start:3920 stop:6160 length:2241 start_codon:yes stop_codon:yes gene_type:complete